ncbi:hypothetical protein DOTSEDRAFT_27728 [Dothistroma septosporum NZE10]|uniref:Uncharacterized protein n=1 Tax=Dothistroma septosporum (strain NZE10 / CBS 128990) TaxID=675120 RepID=N1PC62_DOTSN|nr:hypothetical protein DOTSEDRAFT_27728 [Dothistroma septosporum NZE10]
MLTPGQCAWCNALDKWCRVQLCAFSNLPRGLPAKATPSQPTAGDLLSKYAFATDDVVFGPVGVELQLDMLNQAHLTGLQRATNKTDNRDQVECETEDESSTGVLTSDGSPRNNDNFPPFQFEDR